MGQTWATMRRKELILAYNGILWGLKEQCHCRVRTFGGANYVIPQVWVV
jgi:hypothetical protein